MTISAENFICIFVKLKIHPEKYFYFRKNYDMSGKIFVCSRKLRYLRKIFGPRADGAKRRARVLIPPGYLHLGKRKH